MRTVENKRSRRWRLAPGSQAVPSRRSHATLDWSPGCSPDDYLWGHRIAANRSKFANCLLRFMAGSPKASIRAI